MPAELPTLANLMLESAADLMVIEKIDFRPDRLFRQETAREGLSSERPVLILLAFPSQPTCMSLPFQKKPTREALHRRKRAKVSPVDSSSTQTMETVSWERVTRFKGVLTVRHGEGCGENYLI